MSEEQTVIETQEVNEPVAAEEVLSEVKAAARRKEVIQMGGGAVACVNCEKRSYPAETIYFEQIPYHTDCFKCVKCVKRIEGTFNAAMFDHKLYCRRCFQHDGLNRLQAQVKWTPKTGSAASSSSTFSKFGGGSVPCTSCTKACYPAETVSFEGKPYHNNCISCTECKTGCTINNIAQFDDKLYCTKCWNKNGFNRKQLESAQKWEKKEGNYSEVTLKLGGGSIPCNSCTKACYPAETVSFEGKPYHSGCLACSDCRTGCTVNNIAQFDDKLYCSKCWTKHGFNRKQLESAQKWEKKEGNYSEVTLKLGGGSIPCTSCTKACYPAETVSFEGKPYHNNCIACSDCKTGCTINNIAQFEDKLYCNKCWTKYGFNRKQLESAQKWTPKETTAPSGAFAKFGGGGNKCQVCEKTVYPAETISYEGRMYHPKCFNCTHCEQRIPTVNNAEHKGPVPYCKRCFQQLELWRAEK